MKLTYPVKLGIRVRDKVTGFVGIVDAEHRYLNGCVQLSIQPPVDKDNKLPEGYRMDINKLEYVDEGICEEPESEQPAAPETEYKPGGPLGRSDSYQRSEMM